MHEGETGAEAADTNNLMILSEASAQELVEGSSMETVYITQADGTLVASNEMVASAGEEVIHSSDFYEVTAGADGEAYDHLGELVGNLEAALQQQHMASRKRKGKSTYAYTCDVCSKPFQTVSNLNRHYRIHTGIRPYVCNTCGAAYGQIDHLKRHEMSHTGQSPYQCAICHKQYQEKGRYVIHMRTHSGEKPFECGVCLKTFSYKEGLSKHTKVHTGLKLYECDFCMKKFSESQGLRLHRRIHTGERPYACKFCFKGFITKKALRIHARVHTGERPFKCTSCDKDFMSSSALGHHVKKCHDPASVPSTPFTCDVCQRSFPHPSTLRNHQLMHSDEKIHCAICGKDYKRRTSLLIHLKTHGDELREENAAMYCYLCHKQFTVETVYTFHMKLHRQLAAGIGPDVEFKTNPQHPPDELPRLPKGFKRKFAIDQVKSLGAGEKLIIGEKISESGTTFGDDNAHQVSGNGTLLESDGGNVGNNAKIPSQIPSNGTQFTYVINDIKPRIQNQIINNSKPQNQVPKYIQLKKVSSGKTIQMLSSPAKTANKFNVSNSKNVQMLSPSKTANKYNVSSSKGTQILTSPAKTNNKRNVSLCNIYYKTPTSAQILSDHSTSTNLPNSQDEEYCDVQIMESYAYENEVDDNLLGRVNENAVFDDDKIESPDRVKTYLTMSVLDEFGAPKRKRRRSV